MKVLMINGSPHAKGNTYTALHEMEKIFAENCIDTEIVHIGNQAVRGCIACYSCAKNGKCVFNDIVNEMAPKFEACDGLVIGSPVYYASANATLIAFLDRLFYSTHFDKTMKVGASVVAARRGGLTRRSTAGCRRSSDHADFGKEYDFSDEKYCSWKESIRIAGERAF